MANREQIEGVKRWAPPVLTDRLPIAVPFSLEEWGRLDFSKATKTPAFAEYFERSVRAVMQSERAPIYLDAFAMIAHIGRLPEFDDESFGDFLAEAFQQQFTAPQLERALKFVWDASSPRQAPRPAAAVFEFLAFSAELGQKYAEDILHTERLSEIIAGVRGLAFAAFGAAVNAELGTGDSWDHDESQLGEYYEY